MSRKLLFLFAFGVLFLGLVSPIFALEKVKLGTAVRMGPEYLIVSAAEEKGFWKENALEIEWVPFAGTAPLFVAVAAGSINIGMGAPSGPMVTAERGVPVFMVAESISSRPWHLMVRTDSPYRDLRDLKGARVGVTTLGGITHVFGRIMFKAQGVEKDVRFVGAGGVREALAGLRVGAFEALVTGIDAAAALKLEGVIRDIASTADYLPKPWFDQAVFARKDFARTQPEVTRKLVKAVLQSIEFGRKNPLWATEKLKSSMGYSEQAANLVYNDIKFSITGKLDRKAVENVRRLFIEYGIISEKVPAVDELFTNEYVS